MIKISSTKYNNEFRTSQDLPVLLACIGEKIKVTIDFYYEDITYSTIDDQIVLKPDAADVDLYDTAGVIYSTNASIFANTIVGDKIGVFTSGAFSYYTVAEKFDNHMIRTDYSGAKVTLTAVTDYVFNCTPLNGFKYAYNLIDSGASFNSLIDGEYQQGVLNSLDCTNTANKLVSFTGIKSYQIGSLYIKGAGAFGGGATLGTSVQQKFTITHNTVITPFFLPDQYSDLLLGIKPPYFDANTCLNYINKISIGRYVNDPNGLQEILNVTDKSNTGWFGENLNGGPTNYSISSLVMKKGTTVISQLEYGTDITVEITVDNLTDTPFSNTNTKYIFGFNYLPNDDSLIQNNGFDQTRNFLFDSKLNTLGSGSVNGDNFGTPLQVIKSLTSTYSTTGQAVFTATINIDVDAQAIIDQDSDNHYQMWLIVENHALSAVNTDKVPLLVSVNSIYKQLYNSNLITFETTNPIFITHPHTSPNDAIEGSDMNIFPVDDIVAYSEFFINYAGLPADSVKIKKVQNKLLIRDTSSGQVDIVLEDTSINTASYPIIGGKAQAISFTQDRVFNIESGVRKTISFQREYASDSTNLKWFTLSYPFLNRWEYWVQLINNTTTPSDLFNSSLPFNGINNFWHRMANIASLYYQITFTLEQNGIEFTQQIEAQISGTHNYNEGAPWATGNSIKSYDGATEITSGGVKYILGYKDTTIKVKFPKIGDLPTVADVGIVIWIETFEQGGVGDIKRISSYYNVNASSWFKSSDTSSRVIVTKSGSDYFGECKIDYTKIPANSKFTIYARLYDFYDLGLREFEDGDPFEFEDGDPFEFEDSTGALSAGVGNAIKQDFVLISSSPTIGQRGAGIVAQKEALNIETECCYTMPALAETLYTDDAYNDKYTAKFFWNNSFVTIVMKLQKFTNGAWADLATLTNDAYGTYYGLGTYQNIYSENFVGYLIDWNMIMVAGTGFGEGNYRVKCIGTPIFGAAVNKYSMDFKLMEYTNERADETVRIEWWNNGNSGNLEDDTLRLDYGTLNLYNQLRLPDSIFGFDTSVYTSTYVRYQSGKDVWTQDEQVEEYILKTGRYTNDLHRILKLDTFFGDEIRVTDYNALNPTTHENRYVIRSSNYEPKWIDGIKRAQVEVKFKQAYQNHYHKRC